MRTRSGAEDAPVTASCPSHGKLATEVSARVPPGLSFFERFEAGTITRRRVPHLRSQTSVNILTLYLSIVCWSPLPNLCADHEQCFCVSRCSEGLDAMVSDTSHTCNTGLPQSETSLFTRAATTLSAEVRQSTCVRFRAVSSATAVLLSRDSGQHVCRDCTA